MADQPHFIKPEQLRIGLYVHLDLGWMDHPFTFNNFKIKDEGQIAEIRKLGLSQIRYDPLRSDSEPLSVEPPSPLAAVVEKPVAAAPLPDERAEGRPSLQQQRLQELQQAIQECEKNFVHATGLVRQIEKDILNAPSRATGQAAEMVGNMVESLLTEGEVVLHAMQPKPGAAEQYTHALNVAVLTLVLAKSLDISEKEANILGMGAMFHDVGKAQIPDRIARKADPLTKAEISLMQQHSSMGAKYAKDVGMDPRVVAVIQQHHEYMDGSGFPDKLKGEQIDRLTRVVGVANLYDNLCNPINLAQAMTPYEALSHMFAHQRSKCDPDVLKLLIKTLGVYPPGSLVRLSDNSYGIVVSVNPSKPLRPYVLLYAPDVPRHTPMLIDLGIEAGLSVTHCLRPNQLPGEVLEYLDPAKRINYFFSKEKVAA